MPPPSILLLADSRLPTGGHAHSGGLEMAVQRGLVESVDDLTLYLAARIHTTGHVVAAFAATAHQLATSHPPSETPLPPQPGRPTEPPGPTATEASSSPAVELGFRPSDRRPSTPAPTVEHSSLSPIGKNIPNWPAWDHALSARTLSAAARTASRAQGAALLRTASRMWRTPALTALAELGRPHQPLVLGAATCAAGGTSADAAALAVHHLVGGACSAAVRLLGLDPLAVAAAQASLATLADRAARNGDSAARKAIAADDPAILPATGAVLPELLAARHFQTEVTLFAS